MWGGGGALNITKEKQDKTYRVRAGQAAVLILACYRESMKPCPIRARARCKYWGLLWWWPSFRVGGCGGVGATVRGMRASAQQGSPCCVCHKFDLHTFRGPSSSKTGVGPSGRSGPFGTAARQIKAPQTKTPQAHGDVLYYCGVV